MELESKVRVESHDEIRRRLRAAGGHYVGRIQETNRIFDDAAGRLRASGRGLRVRSVEVLDGTGPGATLTYKGPRRPGALKCREEREVSIDDAGAAVSILEALGYRQRIVFEKRREQWRLRGCRVELDEVPTLGCFVEVEGPTEEVIVEVMAQLGLSREDHLSAGYVAMLAERMEAGTEDPLEVRFPAGSAGSDAPG